MGAILKSFPGREWIDFAEVKEATLRSLDTLIPELLPNGKRVVNNWVVCNPTRDDKRASLSVSIETGAWFDFATKDRGKNFVSLMMYISGKSYKEANHDLADRLGIKPRSDSTSSQGKVRPAELPKPGVVTVEPRRDLRIPPVLFPPRTHPDKDGKPYFVVAGDEGPPRRAEEKRRHIYRRGGVPVRVKIARNTKNGKTFSNAYRVTGSDGAAGWQFGKPEGFQETPYFAAGSDPFDGVDPIYWPEGEKDVETLSRLGLPAFTFGGTSDLPTTCEQYVSGRPAIILADNDDEGRKHAEDKAALAAFVATSVKIIHFQEIENKQDVSDWIEAGNTVKDLLARIESTEKWEGPAAAGPIPLVAVLAPPIPYPVDALGPCLGPAARAIAHKVQTPVEIAAQSVLAAAGLGAQAHADVRMPFGQPRPLSLMLITVASSGDRKTTTDVEALWAIRRREADLSEKYERELPIWRINVAAWAAEKKKIESDKKLIYAERKEKLERLGAEPPQPLYPLLTAPDPTIEGLIKAWSNAPASLGLFSAEGGQFVGGHGMNPDNKLKTAAAISELWDGRGPKRLRAGDGLTILNGRRLTGHIMLQPAAAIAFLSDPMLRDQGLLSRCLVAAPMSIAGQRLYRAEAVDETAIHSFGETLLRLLEMRWPLKEGSRNELAPPVLEISPDAEVVWRDFYDHVESQSGRGGSLGVIADFAGKAAEHAARIAGVLTIIQNPASQEILAPEMDNAVTLVDWYISEALRLASASMTDPEVARAKCLLDWLQVQKHPTVSLREICRLGPTELRVKVAAERSCKILVEHGWLTEVSQRPHVWKLVAGVGS